MEYEASQVLGKRFATLAAEGLTKSHIARELSIRRADLESLTFGVDVADGDAPLDYRGTSRANLEIVK